MQAPVISCILRVRAGRRGTSGQRFFRSSLLAPTAIFGSDRRATCWSATLPSDLARRHPARRWSFSSADATPGEPPSYLPAVVHVVFAVGGPPESIQTALPVAVPIAALAFLAEPADPAGQLKQWSGALAVEVPNSVERVGSDSRDDGAVHRDGEPPAAGAPGFPLDPRTPAASILSEISRATWPRRGRAAFNRPHHHLHTGSRGSGHSRCPPPANTHHRRARRRGRTTL